MITRTRTTAAVATVLVVLLCAATAVLISRTLLQGSTITAYFASTTSIYPGDDVRVLGVKVGTIESIEAGGTQSKITMTIDRDIPVPMDANAVIVAQNLISARYVQLTPAYPGDGPTMSDGAEIPIDRTAVPVEWDEVKTQLNRLAEELGPDGHLGDTSVSRFIDTAANAMDGNGEKLRQTLAQLAGVGRILADGSGDIADIITNLQTFVTTLKDSNTQIVQFQDRLATLTSVIDGSKSELDGALTNLSIAVGETQRFIAGVRDPAVEQVQRLANVTQILADQRLDVENILHIAPNAIANGYNVYNPDTRSALGAFALSNFTNPTQFICSSIGAIENVTADESSKLCAQYLGPALQLFDFNYLPIPINPYLMPSARPESIEYSEPDLMPGAPAPDDPNSSPATVDEMLLPAERPAP